jgi:cellulose synthase/poly-beta-1,6-N-acetylglucosamine synthase-like glycosyltransferase
MITVTIPVYNERDAIRTKLEQTLEFDYPRERMQILVISDASTDGTDEVIAEFAPRGVELVRMPTREGKTAAENAALAHVRGDIVVNSDASVRVPPATLKRLIVWFGDPTVGVVSCRDVSVAHAEDNANAGESGYVNYEMRIRQLETRIYGIIGASGCFYAIRKDVQRHVVPNSLSRDFAAPLIARENGYRSISADDGICFVPRTASVAREYRRKVRTMARGLETLFYKRRLLNPLRYGWFAWMLLSHKLVRWLVPWALVIGVLALAWPPVTNLWTQVFLALVALGTLTGLIGWAFPRMSEVFRPLRFPAYIVAGLTASLHAWIKALRRDVTPVWEPTRRGVATG